MLRRLMDYIETTMYTTSMKNPPIVNERAPGKTRKSSTIGIGGNSISICAQLNGAICKLRKIDEIESCGYNLILKLKTGNKPRDPICSKYGNGRKWAGYLKTKDYKVAHDLTIQGEQCTIWGFGNNGQIPHEPYVRKQATGARRNANKTEKGDGRNLLNRRDRRTLT